MYSPIIPNLVVFLVNFHEMQDYYSDAYDDSYLDGPTELEEASDSLSSSSSEDIDIIYDNEVRESLLIQEPDEEEDDTYHPSKLNNRFALCLSNLKFQQTKEGLVWRRSDSTCCVSDSCG